MVVPSDHEPGDQHKKDEEDDRQHVVLGLWTDEEMRQSDAHSVGPFAIRIAVFEAVGFLLLVCEAFIAL